MSDTTKIADEALSALAALRIDAELYLEHNLITSVAVASGKVESFEMKEELGAGIRTFDSGKIGFVYTTDLTPEGVRRSAEAARALAAHTDPESANRLPIPPAPPAPDPDTGDLGVEKIETYRKTAIARAMEESARSVDPRVTKVRRSRYSDVVGRVEIRGTAGLSRGASFARVYGSIELNAEEGSESQSGYASDFALKFSGLDPFKIGREAARRALVKIGGARAATRRADVVLDPEVIGSFLEVLAPALSAESVLKGKSLLAGKIGQKIAAPHVDLVDDGRFPGANRTFPFDAEGIPTKRNVLIEGGVLRKYLHDWYTSLRMGVEPCGNAGRASYTSPPRISSTTLYLVPSAASRDEILGRVEDGLYVAEVMGLHTVDTISGEFSLGASGQAIRKGALAEPVTGIGIAGNIIDLLSGIEAVGSDLKLLPAGAAGSTTLVRGLSISGA